MLDKKDLTAIQIAENTQKASNAVHNLLGYCEPKEMKELLKEMFEALLKSEASDCHKYRADIICGHESLKEFFDELETVEWKHLK